MNFPINVYRLVLTINIAALTTFRNPVALNNTVEASVEFQSDGCVATSDEVNYLEHVEVLLTIEYPVRGNLEIDLFSPAG